VCANGASSTCASCKPGWQGANCDACTQSSVCQAASGSGAASCNTQFAYTAHTAYKSYVCDVSATILSNFLAPSRGFWINCNTTRPANSEGGYCRLGLRLKDQPNNPLQCVASDCAFKDGSAEVQCKTTACSCATPDASGNCGPPGARPHHMSICAATACPAASGLGPMACTPARRPSRRHRKGGRTGALALYAPHALRPVCAAAECYPVELPIALPQACLTLP